MHLLTCACMCVHICICESVHAPPPAPSLCVHACTYCNYSTGLFSCEICCVTQQRRVHTCYQISQPKNRSRTTARLPVHLDYCHLCTERKHARKRFPVRTDNSRVQSGEGRSRLNAARGAICLCLIPKLHHRSPCAAGTGCEVSNAS